VGTAEWNIPQVRWKEGNSMKEKITQNQRLDYLVEAFKTDSVQYRDLETPEDTEGKRRILRSLMNIRMPKAFPDDVLAVQDEYLTGRAEEKGIVRLSDIPEIRDGLSIWQGDITRLAVDAIVNAANSQMLGCFVPMHTCIDNCIHTFAGVQLRAECNRQMNQLRIRYGRDYEQPTAVPMLTDGYNLPAKKIVHIVGPIVEDRLTPALEQDLADCYRNTLDLCAENALRSVAFCCISTGVFRFPNQRAAEIAVETVSHWLAEHKGRIDRVIFNVFKDEDRAYYEERLHESAERLSGIDPERPCSRSRV
jgi:O-acetyl-ADP-ribose deacetylase (regulator of RNase III)